MAEASRVSSAAEGTPRIVCAPSEAKIAIRGRPAAAEAIGGALGMGLPNATGAFAEQGEERVLCLGPDEWLLKSPTESTALMRRLEAACVNVPHAMVDVSSTYETLQVSGPASALLINHGCPLDLSLTAFSVGKCTRTLLSKCAIILSRTDHQSFELDVARSFVSYAHRFLLEAQSTLR